MDDFVVALSTLLGVRAEVIEESLIQHANEILDAKEVMGEYISVWFKKEVRLLIVYLER